MNGSAIALASGAAGALAAVSGLAGVLPEDAALAFAAAACLAATGAAAARRPAAVAPPPQDEQGETPVPPALPTVAEPSPEELAACRVYAALKTGAFAVQGAGGAAAEALAALKSALDEATALAELLAAGDLSVRASTAHPGELGQLLARMDAVATNIRGLIAAQQEAVEDVGGRAAALHAAAERLTTGVASQRDALEEGRAAGSHLSQAVRVVNERAHEATEAAQATAKVAEAGGARAKAALAAADRIDAAARDIEQVLETIAGVARQTKLLGVNAAIEAARAGEAGRGFAVVAAEIRALAERAAEATRTIEGFVEQSDAARADCVREVGETAALLGAVAESAARVETVAAAVRSSCEGQSAAIAQMDGTLDAVERVASGVAMEADAAAEASAALERAAGGLRRRLSGVLLEDETMIEAAREAAAELSRRFEHGVASGRVTLEDLFSEVYEPIPGTNPVQHRTPFVDFTDIEATPVIERLLSLGSHVAFACPIDRNGFIPTHNRKVSKPQGADPVWNAANCRNRRFFADRVGLAAGLNESPWLIQAYRRDMGGGTFVTMKDISAPVMVRGRRWGGLRIGYRAAVEATSVDAASGGADRAA